MRSCLVYQEADAEVHVLELIVLDPCIKLILTVMNCIPYVRNMRRADCVLCDYKDLECGLELRDR